jgi:hypothetical protein
MTEKINIPHMTVEQQEKLWIPADGTVAICVYKGGVWRPFSMGPGMGEPYKWAP